jgi:DNA (cytosine-5)-methyltransferase 1
MANYLDLFSGIGGFVLGAYWAGFKFDYHFFSEIDPYCIDLYRKRFPEAIALGDIKEIKGKELVNEYGKGWIVSGGFPCQDISTAGKGAGLEGSRSGLWYEYARLIGELCPDFAVMENVGALTFRGLDSVLGSLAEIGYDAEWQDIRASDVGAPHRRERIWIVAYPNSLHNAGKSESESKLNRATKFIRSSGNGMESRAVLANVSDSNGEGIRDESERTQGRRVCVQTGGETKSVNDGEEGVVADSKISCERGLSKREEEEYARSIFSSKDVADSSSKGLQESRSEILSGKGRGEEGIESLRSGEILADSENEGDVWGNGELESAKVQMREHRGSPENGGREWWATEPDVGRVANGIPHRVDRLKGLGNSIVPQIAYLIFKEIRGFYERERT